MNVYFYYRNGRGDRTRTCSDLNLLFPKQVGYHLPIYTPKLNALSGRQDLNLRPRASEARMQTRLHHALTENSVKTPKDLCWDRNPQPTNSRRGRSGATLLESPEHLGARSHWSHQFHLKTITFESVSPDGWSGVAVRQSGATSAFALSPDNNTADSSTYYREIWDIGYYRSLSSKHSSELQTHSKLREVKYPSPYEIVSSSPFLIFRLET